MESQPAIVDDIDLVRQARDEWIAKHTACVDELDRAEATLATLRAECAKWKNEAIAHACAEEELHIAKVTIARLKKEQTTLRAARTEAERRIALAGGYHERTPDEVRLAALVATGDGDPVSSSIRYLLDLVDAGRNRVYAAEEEAESLRAALTAAQMQRCVLTPDRE